jgi:beta-lactamase regulating signal transducer with metallopeptidase domain
MNTILEQINSAGEAFVDFALPMLVQSGILILILLLIDFLLRRKVRAIFRYWIWMLVLAKLVLPTSLASPLSLGYLFGDRLTSLQVVPTSPQTVEQSPIVTTPIIDLSNIPTGKHTTPTMPTRPSDEPILSKPLTSSPVSPVPISWQGIVFLLWLSIVIAMGLLLLQRAIFVNGLVAQAEEVDDSIKDTFNFCCQRMGVRRKVGLKVSANATSPAVCGLFRPVILLPQNFSAGLSTGQLQAVLLHELAHIKRGDLWINLAQTILQILYFYNPLLWIANAIIRRIREQAVDEAVLVAMGEKAQQYPQTLVSVAKLAFKRPVLSLRLIGVVESKSALASRIKRILTRPIPKSAKLGMISIAAIIIAAAVLLPMAKKHREAKTVFRDKTGLKTEFSDTLSNGTKVELVGLLRVAEGGIEAWKPNGEPTVIKGLFESDIEGRGTVAAFRVQGLTISVQAYSWQGSNTVRLKDTWYSPSSDVWLGAFDYPADRRFGNLLIKTRQRKALFTIPVTEEQLSKELAIPTKNFENFGVTRIEELRRLPEGCFSIKITHQNDIVGEDFFALDKSGELHQHFAESLHQGGSTLTFKFPAEELAGIARCQQDSGEVRFRNISLQPGVKTDVQVEAEGDPQKRGSALAIGTKEEAEHRELSASDVVKGFMAAALSGEEARVGQFVSPRMPVEHIRDFQQLEYAQDLRIAVVYYAGGKNALAIASVVEKDGGRGGLFSRWVRNLARGRRVFLLFSLEYGRGGWWIYDINFRKPEECEKETERFYMAYGNIPAEDQNTGSKLEFRIVPNIDAGRQPILSKEEFKRYCQDLEASGPDTGNKEYKWVKVKDKLKGNFPLTTYNGQQYILACSRAPYVMSPAEGWGLQRVYRGQDEEGRPMVCFWFDRKGGELFYNLTKENLENSLAILIDDKVFSAPTIQTAIRNQAIIAGNFSEREVEKIAIGLQTGMSAAKSDVQVEGESQEDLNKKIEELIGVLKDFKVGDREKWFSAVKELIEIGSPAVKPLSIEIRTAERPQTQSVIAFTLRAIGDSNAIPALIDALERSGFSSDYGVGKADTELSRFIRRYQVNPSADGVRLCRPVREITIALERLTDHTEGHEHFITIGGVVTPEHRDLERAQYREVAQRWRQWWQQQKKAKESGPKVLAAAASEGSLLEFHIVPDTSQGEWLGLTPEDISKYKGSLSTEGPFAGSIRGEAYQWYSIKEDLRIQPGFIVQEYKGKKYLLFCACQKHSIWPPIGTDRSWGLQKVYAIKDSNGRPAIGFEFDKRGGELFYELTKGNIGKTLAVIIDGEVVSTPMIMSPLQNEGTVVGDFTQQEVERMVEAMRKGMPPAKTDVQVEGKKTADNLNIDESKISPPGRFALEFDGIGDYLEIPASESLTLKPPFTIQMWIKPEFPSTSTPDKDRNLLFKGSFINGPPDANGNKKADAYGLGLRLRPEKNSEIAFDVCTANGSIYSHERRFQSTSDWMHLAVVFDNEEGRVYPGMSFACSPVIYKPAPQAPIIIGSKFLIPTGNNFKGQVGEIRIWNKALSNDEIDRLKNQVLTGSEPNLAACWTFEQAEGQVAYDISPNRNHARLGASVKMDDADPNWIDLTMSLHRPEEKTSGQVEVEQKKEEQERPQVQPIISAAGKFLNSP